jgi:hypothetical protein
VTVSVALRDPVADGAKVRLMVHGPVIGITLPQLFVAWKSPAFCPEIDMPTMAAIPVPVFESETVCGELVVPIP